MGRTWGNFDSGNGKDQLNVTYTGSWPGSIIILSGSGGLRHAADVHVVHSYRSDEMLDDRGAASWRLLARSHAANMMPHVQLYSL